MEYDLVFEGGGAKGMVFVGAMQEFEARGHTYKRLLGTSAGAITAALLAAGYTSGEMQRALAEEVNGRSVFTGFMAQPGPYQKAEVLKSTTLAYLYSLKLSRIEKLLADRVVPWFASRLASPYSFLEFGGWYSADHFVEWLRQRLDSDQNQGTPRQYSRLTLAQFFAATRNDLSVVASDTTAGAMLVLNHRTAPDVPLVWAVRMSMSIPLVWQEVVWQPAWGQYQGRDMTGHAIVDGGLLSNFPIELFLSKDRVVQNLMGAETGDKVLGLLIDETCPVEGALAGATADSGSASQQMPVLHRLQGLLNTATGAHDKMVMDAYEALVARLPAKGFGTTEFDMTAERRGLLVTAGQTALAAYFDHQEMAPLGGVSFGLEPEALAVGAAADAQADKIARKILQL